MGIGPLVAWRRASLRSLGRRSSGRSRSRSRPGSCSSRSAPARSRLGADRATRSRAFVARVDRARVRARDGARHALGGASWARAFASLVARNRRRYGGYIVHAADRAARDRHRGLERLRTRSARPRSSRPGQSMAVGGLHAAPTRGSSEQEAEHPGVAAPHRRLPRRAPARARSHPARTTTSPSSRRRTRWRSARDSLTGGDLFLIADKIDAGRHASTSRCSSSRSST